MPIIEESKKRTYWSYQMVEKLMTETEVAERLAACVQTLRKDRLTGAGQYPRFIKLGRSVRYRESDVAEFVASREAYSYTPTRRINRKAQPVKEAA